MTGAAPAKTGILSIDQGTTSSRTILFDGTASAIFTAQEEFAQHYPDDGWVEHDPEDIWQTTLATAQEALAHGKAAGMSMAAIGITNQRETTLVWDRETGKPIYNAIVWQDRRTADTCRSLKEAHGETSITEKTGLLLDPYFSATKIAWILDHVEGARARAEDGKLAFGTVDTFLIWRLTGGKSHVTDATNASRTNLFNIRTQSWDEELCKLFRVPMSVLPKVMDCAADFGTSDEAVLGAAIPISGVAGDQQAATVGQCCFTPGSIKSTYGTGCFVLINTGDQCLLSQNRLLTTIAYQLDGKATYALEGSIFIAGAAVQWLRDELKIIKSGAETEEIAASLESNNGVYLVPAFTGLGAPYWDPDARGAIFGLTRGSGRAEIVRATLESVCYQTHDLFSAMAQDGVTAETLKVDGGMVKNNWVTQFLADILDLDVARPEIMETTALGAAYLAGLQTGVFESLEEISKNWRAEAEFTPQMDTSTRQNLLSGWSRAVSKVLT
jgi:glycerol kinase